MTTENSTLVFGVRTREANASLEQMRRELTKTYDLVDSLTAKQVASSSAMVGSSKDTIASARAVTDALEQQELATREMSRTSVSYRKKVGEANASFKAGLKTTATDLIKFRNDVEKAALDPTTALGLANIEEVTAAARKRISQLQAMTVAEARNNLQALEKAQSSARAKELAALRADITERSKIAAAENKRVEQLQTMAAAEARNNLQTMERAQSSARAKELAALRADITERSKISAARNEQAVNSLKALEDAQSQGRARELAALRASITERNNIMQAAAARHADTRRKQTELAIKYDEMELASRIRVLRRIEQLQSQGYGTSTIARRFGTTALGDVGNLNNYVEQVRVIRETEKAQRQLAESNSRAAKAGKGAGDVLRANRDLMRETHSAARGLAGSLGSLWMTYGSLVPLLTGAALGGVARSTFTVGKDVEYRLQMLQALGNAEATVNQLMPAVHGSMKTPLEAAEGLQQLAQAGLSTHEALSVLTPTLQLATLGEMSVADAALATTAALSTFNLGMHEAVRVGDIFAKGASISNASVAEIAEAMKQAGSGAAAYGLSLEDTVAQVTALAQAGIKGSAAGTAVKNSMKELYAPTNKAAKVMKQIGLETYDAEGKARGYMEILGDLKAVTAEMTDEHQNAMLGAMFNERSRRAIQIFLNDMERLEEMSKGLGDPNGYLAKANERLLDTVEGASNRFQSVIQQSYVRAFDTLRPQIRATIDEMERFAGSDGFIRGVETIGQVFSGAASAISQHAGLIATLAGIYGTLKVAQLAFTGAMGIAAAAVRAKQGATLALSVATGTLTTTTVASTAASEVQAVAQGVLAGAMTRTQGAAAAAAVAFRGLTAAMGLIGAAISLAALAMGTFASSTTPAISESDKLKRSTDAVTQAINAEINAIKERRRQRNLDKGITDVSDANAMQARREEGEKLKANAEAAKIAAEQALQAYQASSGMGMEVMRQQGIAARDAAKASKEATDAYNKHRQELEADEGTRATGIIERRKAKQEQNLQSLLDEMTYERNTILRSKADSETRDFLGGVDESISKVERALQMAGQSAGVAQDYVDGLNNSWGKLRGEIDEKRTLVVNTTNDNGNGGGLEFRSSSANLQTELRNQKTLLSNMRDFRLKIVEDEAKQGVWTSQQAAEKRKEIWDSYQDQYAAKAAETSAKIMALDKGSAALKDLTRQKIQEELEQERRLAAQNQELKLQQEIEESLSRARSMSNTTAVDLEKVRSQLVKDELAQMEELSKRYLPADQMATLEARNRTEAHFNKLLEDRYKLLQQGVLSRPDFMGTSEAKSLQESIRLIEQEKKVAVDAAGAIAMSRYQDTQSITGGYHAALKELGNQAIATGDVVAQSLGAAFTAVGNLAGQLVTTGRANVQQFFADLFAQVAKMYASQFMMQILSAFLPTFGGGGGAGGTGVTSYGLKWTQSAMGNVFNAGSVQKFAKGGAFTNQLATSPTLAPMALFGEAGPEAIMPLTRTAGGELGVKAVAPQPVGMGAGPTINLHVETNVIMQGDGATSQTTVSGADSNGMAQRIAQDMQDAATQAVRRELGQGGLIRQFVETRR